MGDGLAPPAVRLLYVIERLLNILIDDGMSDYEKELAIHDYITGWSRFDYSVFGRSVSEEVGEGSDTPYGVLINQSAMCRGYSSTFQLFMDMLDIECITVYGTPGIRWDVTSVPEARGTEYAYGNEKNLFTYEKDKGIIIEKYRRYLRC